MKHNIASDLNIKTLWQMICISAIIIVGIWAHTHSPKKTARTPKYISGIIGKK
jgi:hypothetical protein